MTNDDRRRAEANALNNHNGRVASASHRFRMLPTYICPDCYRPADRCTHVHEWSFLRRT